MAAIFIWAISNLKCLEYQSHSQWELKHKGYLGYVLITNSLLTMTNAINPKYNLNEYRTLLFYLYFLFFYSFRETTYSISLNTVVEGLARIHWFKILINPRTNITIENVNVLV